MKVFGAFLCTGMMVFAMPAAAGFEFLPPASAPIAQPASIAPTADFDAPMPIIPTEAVSAEPLSAPDTDPVVNSNTGRRMSMPMDAEKLLQATAREERLVINPYPLQDPGMQASHDQPAPVTLEQAMMEETGLLRPVAAPAMGSGNGLVERAGVRKGETPRIMAPAASSITPMPGDLAAGKISRQPLAAASAPVPAPAKSAQTFSEAVGFGRDLPLALALSQVVPPEYSFSFAQNVNEGQSVSWQGGKPWNVVLDEMLASSGMKAVIQNDQVVIQKANS